MGDLREGIAELEHKQWMEWSKAVANEVTTTRRARWKKLWIPYAELSEEQKNQDRVWADQILSLIKEAGYKSPEEVAELKWQMW